METQHPETWRLLNQQCLPDFFCEPVVRKNFIRANSHGRRERFKESVCNAMRMLSRFRNLLRCMVSVFVDALIFFCFSLRSSSALAAENLFLRKQLGLYVERKKKPRRATDSVRFTLAQLSRFFEWRSVLTVVKPDTLIRWHRKGFRLFWKWKSRSNGRPRVPIDLRGLIVHMASNNPTWGEERIANELLLKIGIQISPRIVHLNVTRHPTAEWTMQQFRECVIGDEGYRFIIHDRDSIYSGEVDSLLRASGLRVLKTPYRAPQANAFCERLIGSASRECLDFMIPINEDHVRWIMKQWVVHTTRRDHIQVWDLEFRTESFR